MAPAETGVQRGARVERGHAAVGQGQLLRFMAVIGIALRRGVAVHGQHPAHADGQADAGGGRECRQPAAARRSRRTGRSGTQPGVCRQPLALLEQVLGLHPRFYMGRVFGQPVLERFAFGRRAVRRFQPRHPGAGAFKQRGVFRVPVAVHSTALALCSGSGPNSWRRPCRARAICFSTVLAVIPQCRAICV
ncbi:hypothetical protein G6F24_015443 [Rhizopus arrhizus]|nr:hypothetical protein G6F24_015443 [Rhizopus arrhizus]